MIELIVYEDEIRKASPKMRRSVDRTTELASLDLYGNVKKNAPQDHGRLAGSFFVKKKGPRLYSVYSDVVYADVQDKGSDPYVIKPRRKKALRFVVKGQTIFAKRVKHPGIKGKRYVDKSIKQTTRPSRLGDFIHQALSEEDLL